MNVRAKFRVSGRTTREGYKGTEIHLSAVGDDGIEENKRYHKYTPSGTMTIYVDNPVVEEELQNGRVYYLDFTRADK